MLYVEVFFLANRLHTTLGVPSLPQAVGFIALQAQFGGRKGTAGFVAQFVQDFAHAQSYTGFITDDAARVL